MQVAQHGQRYFSFGDNCVPSSRHEKAVLYSSDSVGLYKGLVCQLVEVLLRNRFDARLSTKALIRFKYEIIVLGIEDDKLIFAVDIGNGDEVGNEGMFCCF